MHTVFEGKHIFVKERDGWEYAERTNATEAVAVIAVTDNDELVLTEQYRRAVDASVIDWVAGLLDSGKDAEATARQELSEEAGFDCTSIEQIASGPSSPGITSEIVHIVRAHGLRRTGEGGGVDGEKIAVHVVPRREALDFLRRKESEGVLVDLKVRLYLTT
jgi:ADP-ribose pyrophosphatase